MPFLLFLKKRQRTCNGLAVFWPTVDLAEYKYMVV